MTQHIGHGLLCHAKHRERYVFWQIAEAVLTIKCPVQGAVFEGLDQVRTQAGFNAQTTDLAGVKRCGYIAHLGQRFFEQVAQTQAMALQVFWHTSLQPACLKRGGGQ